MNRYTLIAYRASMTVGCGRGCCSDSSSSKFDVHHETEIEPLIEHILDYEDRNRTQDREEDDWELKLYLDGHPYDLISQRSEWRQPTTYYLDDDCIAMIEYDVEDQTGNRPGYPRLDEHLVAARQRRADKRLIQEEAVRLAAQRKEEADKAAAQEKKRQAEMAELKRLSEKYPEVITQ